MKTLAHFSTLLLILLSVPSAWAAENRLGAEALHQALTDLGTDLRLMCVAAHPDDEDGATLALYRMRYGLETYAVIATRGEGGQNEIGPELYNDLGVIRTREMQAASEVTGAHLRFLDLPEFGFSKTSEETFSIWGRDEPVRRLVRTIREVQPDVIVTNHDTEQGHGHHQAIGIALIEAFDAAGDAARFPEEGPGPWQASRLYVRVWEPAPGAITIPIHRLDPARGLTYAEVAARALEQHRSQGMQFFIDRYRSGDLWPHYTLVRQAPQGVTSDVPAPGAEAESSLLKDLRDRVAPEERLMAQELLFQGLEPDVAAGLRAYAAQLALGRDTSPLAHRRWQRANAAAVTASEIRLTAHVEDGELVPGQQTTVVARLRDHGLPDAARVTTRIEMEPWFQARPAAPVSTPVDSAGEAGPARMDLTVATDARPTLPEADRLFDPHFLAPQIRAVAEVETGDGPLRVEVPLRVDVSPPLAVSFLKDRYLVRHGAGTALQAELLVRNAAPGALKGVVALTASQGLRLAEPRVPVSLASEGDRRVMPLRIELAPDAGPGDYRVRAAVEGVGETAEALVRVVAVAVPQDLRVGIVRSYDDTLADTLDWLGVPHEPVELADFAPDRLDRFSCVLVDIRAYLVRPDLAAHNRALLDYVHRGGTMVVMYQKTLEWRPEFAPYPLRISNNRVTREDAPVDILAPNHPLFRAPNRIGPRDWDGWVQERGLYFADRWDGQYTPLVRTVDPGEDIPDGSLLVASYGSGTYVYTALVWYRQLRDLNPGALRLFANLIGL